MIRHGSVQRTPSARRFDAGHGEGSAGCPACGLRHPIAPVGSRHLEPDGIQHDWHCDACGHDWTTTLPGTGRSLRPAAPVQRHHDNDGGARVLRISPADCSLLRSVVPMTRTSGASATVLPFRL
jgi:hypothetical protein